MKYYIVRGNNKVEEKTYKKPLGLFRFEHEKGSHVLTERFDKKTGEWVHYPGMVAFTGIGGTEFYEEVNEDEALYLINKWGFDDGPLQRIQTKKLGETVPGMENEDLEPSPNV